LQIAWEAGGHYYWMADEMECAGHHSRLVHLFGVNYFPGQRQLFLPINDNYKLLQSYFH
jgi:hypothetical protein